MNFFVTNIATKNYFSDEIFRHKMQQNFVRNGFSDENFHRYMCLDFLKNSFSDELFHHYMYPNIVLGVKLFDTKYDLITEVFLVKKYFLH